MLRRTVLPIMAAAILVGSTATSASADSAACTSKCAGYAHFVSYGEHLYVEDGAADGHSAVVVYYFLPGGTRYGWNPYGAHKKTVDINLDMPEGAGITYEICLGEYGSRTVLWSTCSDVVSDRA